MFSRRTAWDRAENELTRRLGALRARGAPLLDLTESNPTHAGLAYPAERILSALADPGALRYEPDPRGLRTAREAVAAHLRRDGAAVSPDELLLTASTSEAYAWLFKLLCEPGDSVLAFSPSYPLLEYLTALESVELVHAHLLEAAGWALDLDEVRRLATPRTRAVIAVNPANPTGQFLARGELDALLALCAERGWAFICDEVFNGYGVGEDAERVRSVAGRESPALTFALSGLSKAAGLPQLKLV
ncbi:MAG TPA: pyridoxal phosphate-dependent aminotransferase [Myxococcaceae bacterium]|nr:pyridoxal phosphate-dependent aminotransferase [Myxococcaceae bacterium]